MTRDALVDKDPAVVAVASVPNPYSYQTYDAFINNPIPDPNNTSMNPQKTTTFDTSSISTIPTQTFTNQQFAALIPSSAGFSAVPVTIATVPITGLVAPDMTGGVAGDMMTTQTYGNHQNFMNADKQQTNANTSHERGNTFNDEHRNRNLRNRSDPKKNMNGTGGRPRNPNRGQYFNEIFFVK